jgi:hypothetical protein
MCHTDSNTGEVFCNSCGETLAPPLKIIDHIQSHVIHSEHPTRHSRLNEAVYEEKITVNFETNLFMNKINGIILGDMTRLAV